MKFLHDIIWAVLEHGNSSTLLIKLLVAYLHIFNFSFNTSQSILVITSDRLSFL